MSTSFLNPEGSAPEDENIFKYPGHSNDATNLWRCCFASCCDPNMMAKIPRGHLVMDCTICPETHATSVTTQEGNEMGVWGPSFWLVPHSVACFVQGLRSEFWKRGTFNDLQQFVFNKQWQTTSSTSTLPCSPTLQAFIFAQPLNQALRKLHWNRHGPEEARLQREYPLISGMSFSQDSRVAIGKGKHCYISAY